MGQEKKVDDLLGKLISHWCDWEQHEEFYLETLAPQLTKETEVGDETERQILNALKEILSAETWHKLPVLLRDKYKRKVQEIEQEKIRQHEEEKCLKKERFLAKNRKKEKWIQEERSRIEKKKAFAVFRDWFERNFLEADGFYEETYSNSSLLKIMRKRKLALFSPG